MSSRAWINSKTPEFVRDVFRDFCLAAQVLEEQFVFFDHFQKVDFAVIKELLGQERHKGLLWRLKDTAHHVFRNPEEDCAVGQFLDWALGYIFHEVMKLKEDAYQRLNYAPWFDELKGKPMQALESEISGHLFRLVTQTLESMRREIDRIRFIVDQCRKLLPVYLERHRDNALLARFIYSQMGLTMQVFGDQYDGLIQVIYGGRPEAMYVLASQSLRQGGWVNEASAAMDEAVRINPEDQEVLREKNIVDTWKAQVA